MATQSTNISFSTPLEVLSAVATSELNRQASAASAGPKRPFNQVDNSFEERARSAKRAAPSAATIENISPNEEKLLREEQSLVTNELNAINKQWQNVESKIKLLPTRVITANQRHLTASMGIYGEHFIYSLRERLLARTIPRQLLELSQEKNELGERASVLYARYTELTNLLERV